MKKQIYLLTAALTPFFCAWVYFDLLDGSALAKWIYLASKAFILIFPLLYIYFAAGKLDFKKSFRFDLRQFAYGTLCGIMIFGLGFLLLKIPAVMQIAALARPAVESKMVNFSVSGHFVLMALIISFFHSMLEEYYWRLFLYGELAKIMRGKYLPRCFHFSITEGIFHKFSGFRRLQFFFPYNIL